MDLETLPINDTYKAPMNSRLKVIIDTNIWRYLTDRNEVFQLMKITSDYNLRIVMPPSIPLEVARMSDKSTRSRILSSICHERWERLMPEAYSQSMELLDSIRRHRHDWIIQDVDRREFDSIHGDWTRKKKGFWDFIRKNPDEYLEIDCEKEAAIHNGSLDEIKKQRRSMIEQGFKFEQCDLSRIQAKHPYSDGELLEPWRIENEHFSWRHLFILSTNPYQEWITPFINRKGITRSMWRDFWYYSVEARDVPRWWSTWGFQLLASTRSISHGSPCDIQLSNYLYDADYIMSCDKIFIDITNKCRTYAPLRMAKGQCLTTTSCLTELREILVAERSKQCFECPPVESDNKEAQNKNTKDLLRTSR